MKFLNKKTLSNLSVEQEKGNINFLLTFVDTCLGLLRLALFALPLSYTHLGIPREHEDVTRPFSSLVNCES